MFDHIRVNRKISVQTIVVLEPHQKGPRILHLFVVFIRVMDGIIEDWIVFNVMRTIQKV